MCTDAARPPRASKAPQTYGAPRETPFSSEGSPFDDLTAFAAHQLWAGTNGAPTSLYDASSPDARILPGDWSKEA